MPKLDNIESEITMIPHLREQQYVISQLLLSTAASEIHPMMVQVTTLAKNGNSHPKYGILCRVLKISDMTVST